MEFFKSEHGRPFVLWAWDARVELMLAAGDVIGHPARLGFVDFARRLTIHLGVTKVAGGVA